MRKKIGMLCSLVLVLGLFAGCGGSTTKDTKPETTENNKSEVVATDGNNPVVTITMENGGVIEIELYPEIAPNTVANFVSLVEAKYYDGLIFHRVIPGFMIQGGDPTGTGTGGPGYSIAGEFTSNGFKNDLKHDRGVISMARSSAPDSAGSQFFIMVAEYPSLDGQYASFGKVLSGMDVVDEIVATKTGAQDKPVDPQTMKTVTVERNGAVLQDLVKV